MTRLSTAIAAVSCRRSLPLNKVPPCERKGNLDVYVDTQLYLSFRLQTSWWGTSKSHVDACSYCCHQLDAVQSQPQWYVSLNVLCVYFECIQRHLSVTMNSRLFSSSTSTSSPFSASTSVYQHRSQVQDAHYI